MNSEGELVCRLMEALQGANVPGADARCLSDGTSSIGSFLRVAKPDDESGNYYFDINLPIVNEGVDPLDSLQTLVDMWGGCDYTGISDEATFYQVGIHPNPASETVNFTLPTGLDDDNCRLMIYNTNGKLVSRIDDFSNGQAQLSVSAYSSGIYYFQLFHSGKLKANSKFIVK